MPHPRAAYIFGAMSALPAEAAPAPELLGLLADALAWPLLLLRADGTLLHANRAARQMLRQGRPLRLGSGHQVLPAAAQHRATLAGALHEVAASGRGRALHWMDAAVSISATLSRLDAEVPVLLLALTSADGGAGTLEVFAQLHGLTAAESAVLAQLARGASCARAAAALGVGVATVRSQTASLRAKTGHASVAALLRSLAALPALAAPPLPGQGN
jgi:DNA-binding CsgD family transcriptional regulator